MGRFLNGLLIGVGVGLLVAPEKGEDIRNTLADAAGDWRDKLNRLLGRGGARLDDLRSFLDSEIEGMNDDAKGKISKILNELAPDERGQGGGQEGGDRAAGNGQRQEAGARQNAAAGQQQGRSEQQGEGRQA